MTVGTIDTSILTDIANALRMQAGVATLYKPREMAAAVAALDGTNAGGYVPQSYKQLESGVLSDSVFEDIADAIRGQNGLSVTYQPGEMAAAILALTWDVGLKPRAVLTSLGTLEFNYVDGRHCYSGGLPVDAWEVSTTSYASQSARPWESVKAAVRKVVIHSSWPQSGILNCAYWFTALANCVEVSGFENLSGMVDAKQLFVGCSALESIYCAGNFDNSSMTNASGLFYGCNRLVGGVDGTVPKYSSGASVCKLGPGGVLTYPGADSRTWFHAFFYADGGAVLSASSVPESGRELLASGRICAIGQYQALGFTPWDGNADTHRQKLTSAVFAADMATFSYLNLDFLFYSCINLASVTGLGNLANVHQMQYTFASIAAQVLDFRGFDPSSLTDLFYCFSGCSSLTTIYADSTWALPSSGISGSQCFYGCSSLVGGNGTAWASSKTAYTYFRIDTASTPGYLTA
ncbi:MAG: hypothetical protein IJ087_10845 [Eggerthellaceae bacterium]|nr:hypothetical protein [Eggerthellaceae bacterium]